MIFPSSFFSCSSSFISKSSSLNLILKVKSILPIDNIEHFFPPPEEREIQRRNNELEEAKKINRTQKKIKSIESNPKIKSIAATKRCSVPLAPPPPPPPPPISSVPSAPHGPLPRVSAPEVDVAIQIQNMKLKKVVKEEKQEKKDKNIGGDTNFLQNALSTAIRNRRNNLHMHDEDNEEEEEDDWD